LLCDNSIDVKLTDPGTVKYKGEPKSVNQQINGIRINSERITIFSEHLGNLTLGNHKPRLLTAPAVGKDFVTPKPQLSTGAFNEFAADRTFSTKKNVMETNRVGILFQIIILKSKKCCRHFCQYISNLKRQ